MCKLYSLLFVEIPKKSALSEMLKAAHLEPWHSARHDYIHLIANRVRLIRSVVLKVGSRDPQGSTKHSRELIIFCHSGGNHIIKFIIFRGPGIKASSDLMPSIGGKLKYEKVLWFQKPTFSF